MENIESGNVYTKQNGARGWIIGKFKDNPLPYPFETENFSIKWARLKKGDKNDDAKSDSTSKTLTILMEGKQRIDFPETNESFVLENEGDYLFFEPNVLHKWEAIENNLTITIRWPS